MESIIKSTAEFETLSTDLEKWEIGPHHEALPGPMRFEAILDGEIISSCHVEIGYLHRGFEKILEKQFWNAVIPYSDRLDPDGAIFGELAFCLAVEEIADVQVPERASAVRVILSELTRITSHLHFLIRMAKAVEAETPVHYVLREREKILDLFELLTGARFSLNFLRIGGVVADVTEGFLERVLEICELIQIRIKEYNDVFSFNHAFLRRTSDIGVVSEEQVRRLGLTGPIARASGIFTDVRKEFPYCGFDMIDFEVPQGRGDFGTTGDAHDRYLIHLREMTQSIEIIRQAVEKIRPGEFWNQKLTGRFRVPNGEAFSRIESNRGFLGCHVVSEGTEKPSRIHFRTPSAANILVIPEVMKGLWVADVPAVLASLNLSLTEVDR